MTGEPPAWGQAPTQVAVPQTHQGALWSMILGIIGLVCGVLTLPTSGITAFGLVCSPVAFGLGLWSSSAIAKQPASYGNRGMAIAGWVMGLVGMILAVLMVLLAIAVIAFVIYLFSLGTSS